MATSPSQADAPIALPAALRLLRRVQFPHKLGLLERLFGRRLAACGCAWVETASGPVWKLDLRSNSHRWIVYGDYEGPAFIPWTRQWLRRGDVVIDSGANIGQTTLYFAAVPGVRVFAFEPNPVAREWLQECVGRQRWDVRIVPAGLDAAAETRELRLPMFVGPADAQATFHLDWYADRGTRQVTVPVTAMDSFLAEHGIGRVRLWKLDVEGWEHRALAGASASLARQAFDAIYIELTRENLAECSAMFERAGYRLHHFARPGRIVAGLPPFKTYTNLLALPA